VLPACQTIRPIIGLECPITVIPELTAPDLQPIEWEVAHGLFYTSEENFEIYATNLTELINYAKSLQAQNTYYVDAIESCER
jgi:hypothetical protein